MTTPGIIAELDRDFRVLAQLGEGATARVWLALAKGPGDFAKLVVLKNIRRELLDDPHVRSLFLAEAKLAARLNHPNIVYTNQVLEAAGQPVLVMEYLDGVPLSAVLEKQREGHQMPLALLLRVISDALAGLQAAHELRDYDGTELHVVHRDISPQNLFITFAGQVKVLDFGIAQLSAQSDGSRPRGIQGKLRYVSPEQIAGALVEKSTDLYSMGVILWEIATGRRMWEGLRDAEVLARTSEHALPNLRALQPEIDEDLATIIERALQLEPSDRYDSAQEFQAALDEYVATLGAPVQNRDLGRALSKLFEDVRLERAQTIEHQLKVPEAPIQSLGQESDLPELTSFSHPPHPTKPQGSTWLRTSLLVTLFMASLGLLFLEVVWPERLAAFRGGSKAQRSSISTSSALSEHDPSPDHDPSPERATARPTATPPPATPAPTAPSTHRPPAPSTAPPAPTEPARIDSIASPPNNEEPATGTAQGEAPKLRPRPVPEKETSEQRPASQAPSAPTNDKTPARTSGASPKLNCDPPFFYDERGIKVFRRPCLLSDVGK